MAKTLPSNAGGEGLIPGEGAKIPHASWPKTPNIKQKPFCHKFNKDLILKSEMQQFLAICNSYAFYIKFP